MIKKIAAITLLSAVLFSCSTSNEVVSNGLFQKRKYNKGWYANKSAKVKDSKGDNTKEILVEEIAQQNEITNDVVAKQEVKTISREFVAKSDYTRKNETVLASNENSKEVIKTNSVIIAKQENAIAIEELKRIVEAKPVEIREVLSKKGSGSSGLGLLVLVLLAIFIPPVAVLLVDGLSSRFWIDLILALLGIGAFGLLGALGGIAYLAAIIYALIIVLE